MRTIVFSLLFCGALAADVLLLKDGRKVSGKIVEKPSFYEVTTEGGLKTFLKEEADKVIASPKEFLGDSETLLDEAKKDYKSALEIAAPAEQNTKLKEAIAKLTKAREGYAAARELFWEDKYSDLDLKLVQVMQLMRLLRERVGSEIAKRPEPSAPKTAPSPVVTPKPVAPAPTPQPDDAVAVLIDPAKRGDASRRTAARDAFRSAKDDLAAAAAAFLSRPEPEAPVVAALQEYFAKPWIKGGPHLEAAKWLAERLAALRKASPAAPPDALALFAAGHLSLSPPGPETEKAAQALGFLVRDGSTGTAEGLAARDMIEWIASGDFDLAALAYVKEFRATADTPLVRFLWSYALARDAQKKKRGFERSFAALDVVRPPEPAVRDHVAALAKSVRNAAVCSACGGEGKTRCTSCHGKKEVRSDCPTCKGVGATRGANGLASCGACAGRGYMKLLRCDKCKDGYPECRQCDRRPRSAPELEDMFLCTPCGACDGRGQLFRKVALPCRSCLGLGQKLTPRADPTKTLP